MTKKDFITETNILETETIGEGRHHYFIDLRMTANSKEFLKLVHSERVVDNEGKVSYKREVVRVFEENLGPLFAAMLDVFGRYNAKL